MNSRTSSGMLRKISTYTPPTRCSHFTGAMRNAATRGPTTMAIANETTTIRTVPQKPELTSDQWSVRTLSTGPTQPRGRMIGARRRGCPASIVLDELDGFVDADRGHLALLTGVLADPL